MGQSYLVPLCIPNWVSNSLVERVESLSLYALSKWLIKSRMSHHSTELSTVMYEVIVLQFMQTRIELSDCVYCMQPKC